MARGTIARLIRSHGYIFILGDNGYELFFLRKELRGIPYDSLREGQHIEFARVRALASEAYQNGGSEEVFQCYITPGARYPSLISL